MNSTTHLDDTIPSQLENETIEHSKQWDDNLSPEGEYFNQPHPAPHPEVIIKHDSPDEKSIRIVLSDDHGQIREYNVVIPEGKYGKFKVTLRYSGAGPSRKVKLSAEISCANVAATSSVQVQQQLKTGENEGKGERQLKRNPSDSPPPQRFPCRFPNCTKSFKSRGAERSHYRSVHLALKYKCTLCASTYQLVPGIYKHLRSAHQEELAMKNKIKTLFQEVCNDE